MLFDSASDIGDPVQVNEQLFLVPLDVFDEIALPRIVREIDDETHAPSGCIVPNTAGVYQDNRRLRVEFGKSAGRVQPHPAAANHEAITSNIAFLWKQRQLRSGSSVPAGHSHPGRPRAEERSARRLNGVRPLGGSARESTAR